jgi:hypothetical protein
MVTIVEYTISSPPGNIDPNCVHRPEDLVVDVIGMSCSTSDEFDFVLESSLFYLPLCERVGHL